MWIVDPPKPTPEYIGSRLVFIEETNQYSTETNM